MDSGSPACEERAGDGVTRKQMGKLIQFFREVKVELGKVVWPTRREALKLTGIVILFSIFVSLFLGLIDYGLARLVGFFLER